MNVQTGQIYRGEEEVAAAREKLRDEVIEKITEAEARAIEDLPARKRARALEDLRRREANRRRAQNNRNAVQVAARAGEGVNRKARRDLARTRPTKEPDDPARAKGSERSGGKKKVVQARFYVEYHYRRIRFYVSDPEGDPEGDSEGGLPWRWAGEWRIQSDRSVDSWAEERRAALTAARRHLRSSLPGKIVDLKEWDFKRDGVIPEAVYPDAADPAGGDLDTESDTQNDDNA